MIGGSFSQKPMNIISSISKINNIELLCNLYVSWLDEERSLPYASTGAPKGNTNALKHGYYTKGAIERRRRMRELIIASKEVMDRIEGGM